VNFIGCSHATVLDLCQLTDPVALPEPNGQDIQLQAQARLQVRQREDGLNRHELLPRSPGRGFARLPRPDPGDLYFDMEGDPLHEGGGLEYLFGFIHREADDAVRFTSFWGHDRAQEKKAFEDAVDFITARLAAHPGAHVYHYAAYEETALKRLAMFDGTREAAVDPLLRARMLVDLYKVVREALRVSVPAYSITNLEPFYRAKRADGVKAAGVQHRRR
jgi:predicted RecB family nuclease